MVNIICGRYFIRSHSLANWFIELQLRLGSEILFSVMGDSTFKPKISRTAQDPVLKEAEIAYMKLIEEKNRERVQKLKTISKRNRATGLAIGTGVLGIYLYSIFAVKQETFLDDFNEPVKVQQP